MTQKTVAIAHKPGVVFRPSYSLPHMRQLENYALRTAPDTTDGKLWVTCAWREPRDPTRVDLHNLCLAQDFRVWNFVDQADFLVDGELDEPPFFARVEEISLEWVKDQRRWHNDSRYQFDVHGKESGNLWNIHLHSEFDPR